MLSNKYLKQEKEELLGRLNIPENYRQMCEPLLGVEEDFIRLAIRSIQAKYTDYEVFFEKEYGLDKEKRNRLVEIYCA